MIILFLCPGFFFINFPSTSMPFVIISCPLPLFQFSTLSLHNPRIFPSDFHLLDCAFPIELSVRFSSSPGPSGRSLMRALASRSGSRSRMEPRPARRCSRTQRRSQCIYKPSDNYTVHMLVPTTNFGNSHAIRWTVHSRCYGRRTC